jgi:hypothetical protein
MVSKREKCAASTNVAYYVENHLIWIIGAIGLLWFSPILYINIIIAVSYFLVNFIFFHRLFGMLVCKNCVYKLVPPMTQEDYLTQYREKFPRIYKIYVTVWALIAWIWPISMMLLSVLLFSQFLSLIILLIFLGLAIVPFFIILNRNVCRDCKIKLLGICPFQKKQV